MTLYVAREALKLWRKIAMETSVELQIFLEKWKLLLVGLIFQWTFHPFIYHSKPFYTVLLWCRILAILATKLSEMTDRTTGSQTLLPLVAKEKDSKSREESHKLLNGNSVDTSDWRFRTQANGKHAENGNHAHSETTKNGT